MYHSALGLRVIKKKKENAGVERSTQGPSWGYSKVKFEIFFMKRGRFSPNVDNNEEMAPRTRTGYPHEGPFVGTHTDVIPLEVVTVLLPDRPLSGNKSFPLGSLICTAGLRNPMTSTTNQET